MVLVVKNPTANAEDIKRHGFNPGSGRSPGGGHGNHSSILGEYSMLGESHGQRRLVSYSPRGCKESDTTEAI